MSLSIILPARNEATTLAQLLPALARAHRHAEIIVVDDGSIDATASVCQANQVVCIRHPYAMGNGAAIKSGARVAKGEVLLFMDADGQHRVEDIAPLLERIEAGYAMAVGARVFKSHAGLHRGLANTLFNRLASWMVGHPVADLTSGFRAVRSEPFRRFLYLLPNGFSYPTTITMCFFRTGLPVAYVPITCGRREKTRSHLKPWREGLRFLLIIFRIGSLYSPLKLFFPIAVGFFLTGLGYYLYTYLTEGRLTNMSALLFSTAVLVFLIGLVSEQITALQYRDSERP